MARADTIQRITIEYDPLDDGLMTQLLTVNEKGFTLSVAAPPSTNSKLFWLAI